MTTLARPLSRGFSLLESLAALLIVAFGLLGLGSLNVKLANNQDTARLRGEATRLAEEKIEQLRSFTRLSPSAGQLAWADLASGNDAIGNSEDYNTNGQFTRTWQVLGTAGDPMRRVQITVAWTDRAGEQQSVSFGSVISQTDPADVGALGFPLPENTTLKRPKNRNLNIPVPAVDLGNGQSVVQLQSNFAVVFSNVSGYVVLTCNFVVHNAAELAGCTEASAYIVAGYVSMHGTPSFPTGLGINTNLLTGTAGTTCSLSDAMDPNGGGPITGYKYYLCVVSVPHAGDPWSGTLRLAAHALHEGSANYLVCRFQFPSAAGVTPNARNVQPYNGVTESLDNQNLVISTANSCPTLDSLATTLHQNCRSNNPNANASRGTDCPEN